MTWVAPAIRRLAMIVLAWLIVAPAAGSAGSLRVEPLEIHTREGAFHFLVEVADTDALRERGLMFRKSLAADRGMLFDFKRPSFMSFWMKNTLIPLDMLFIGADGRIITIAREATPLSESLVPSGGPALGVLELRGGRAAEIGAEPGDLVRNRMFTR